MSVRLKDVASKAGVSVATVSHVVNNTKPVSEKTKARIEAAIKELSYTPNFLAKSLKENRSKVIGLIIPDISNYYFTEIASIIEQRLNDAGYNMKEYTEASEYAIHGGHRTTEALSIGRTKRIRFYEFDTTLWDSPHRYGGAYELYFKHIIPF